MDFKSYFLKKLLHWVHWFGFSVTFILLLKKKITMMAVMVWVLACMCYLSIYQIIFAHTSHILKLQGYGLPLGIYPGELTQCNLYEIMCVQWVPNSTLSPSQILMINIPLSLFFTYKMFFRPFLLTKFIWKHNPFPFFTYNIQDPFALTNSKIIFFPNLSYNRSQKHSPKNVKFL